MGVTWWPHDVQENGRCYRTHRHGDVWLKRLQPLRYKEQSKPDILKLLEVWTITGTHNKPVDRDPDSAP